MVADKIVDAATSFFSKYIYLSDMRVLPEEYARKALKLFLTGIILFVAIATISLLIKFNYVAVPFEDSETLAMVLLVFAAMPLIGISFYIFEPVFKTIDHMRGVERELPFVIALLSIYSAANIAPSRALGLIEKHKDMFPEMSKVVRRIEKLKTLFVLEDTDAIEEEGRRVTSQILSDLLLTAASAERRGGDIYAIFKDKMKTMFEILREQYKSLVDRMKTIGDLVLIFYGVLPLTLYVMFALFASREVVIQSMFYSFIANPLLGASLVFLIDHMYPKTPVKYTKYYKMLLYFVPVGVVIFAVMHFLVPQALLHLGQVELAAKIINKDFPWTSFCIGISLASIFVVPGLRYLRESKRLWDIDLALPSFIRDITEEVKKGSSPSLAILNIAKMRSYGKHLDKIIKRMVEVINVTPSIAEAYKVIRKELSWRGQLIMLLLVEAERIGAKAEVFDEVTDVTREVINSLRIARNTTLPLRLFGLATAAMVMGVTAMLIVQVLRPVAKMADKIYRSGAMAGMNIGLGIRLITSDILPQLVDNILAGAMISMLILGLMTGKMAEGNLACGYQYTVITLLLSVVMILLFFL